MPLRKPEFIGDEADGRGGPRFRFKLPGKMRVLMVLGFFLFILCSFCYFTFLEYIQPNEFGIKEVQIGVNRGIQEKVYTPGLVFVMPFGFQRMHHLPQNVQVLELTGMPGMKSGSAANPRRSNAVAHEPAAKIQTSDGFYVDVDASILYRIIDPYKVVDTLGAGDRYLREGIIPKAEPILKQALGELTTEEFFNSPARVEKADLARDLLDAELQPKGLQVEQVLIRYFRYSPSIQQNIEQKKLQDQLVFTNQSKAKAATMEQELNRVTTQGEMQVKITIQEGDSYKVRKDAEKELYVRKKEAEADLLVQLAEAERTELRNQAMKVLGADRKVAMEMAEVLEGLEVIILPSGGADSMNPLDLDNVLTTFGVGAYMDEVEETTPAPSFLTEEEAQTILEAPKILEEEGPAPTLTLPEITVPEIEEVVQ